MNGRYVLTRSQVVTLALILILPLALWILSLVNSTLGMVWVLLMYFYYLPFGSWLREPFFRPDSDLSFAVLFPGALLTAFVYICAFVLLVGVWRSFGTKQAKRA